MDITQLILDDHHEQRRLFAILEQIDRRETGVLSAIWDRLAAFLELHAQAEEEIFLSRAAPGGYRGPARGRSGGRDHRCCPRPQRHQGRGRRSGTSSGRRR
ncbi:hemerythrin domain-containing protein [Nocardia sp. NPDC050193]